MHLLPSEPKESKNQAFSKSLTYAAEFNIAVSFNIIIVIIASYYIAHYIAITFYYIQLYIIAFNKSTIIGESLGS